MKTGYIVLFIFLAACQAIQTSATPSDTTQSETLPSVGKSLSTPSKTIMPVLPAPTATQTTLERLVFTVSTTFNEMFFDTVIAFANSDGTGFETPDIFAAFRNTGGASGQYLAWSPDGRFLAFDGADKIVECGAPNTDCTSNNYGTFVMEYSKGVISQYVESTLTNSSWAPDSRQFVLSIDQNQNSGRRSDIGDLYIVDVNSGEKTQLTQESSNDLYPSWSPDGQWITFIRYTSDPKYCGSMPSTSSSGDCDNASLYLIHPDGTGMRLLFEPIHIEAPVEAGYRPYNAPVWSPDSQWLAIMIENDGLPSMVNQEIALVNIQTGNLQRLTNNQAKDVFPTWSPEGKKIAFVSGRDGNDEIYVMNFDGTSQINLTQNPAQDYAPVWSPSGTHIAFVSSRESNHKLYIMNPDGTSQIPVNGPYLNVISLPSWLP